MGMMKNYQLRLLEQCSEEKFGQDAIEWAIVSGAVQLTYDLDRDIRECMTRYDEIIEAYRRSLSQTARKPSAQPVPMQRATPARRRSKVDDATSATKKRHVA